MSNSAWFWVNGCPVLSQEGNHFHPSTSQGHSIKAPIWFSTISVDCLCKNQPRNGPHPGGLNNMHASFWVDRCAVFAICFICCPSSVVVDPANISCPNLFIYSQKRNCNNWQQHLCYWWVWKYFRGYLFVLCTQGTNWQDLCACLAHKRELED